MKKYVKKKLLILGKIFSEKSGSNDIILESLLCYRID